MEVNGQWSEKQGAKVFLFIIVDQMKEFMGHTEYYKEFAISISSSKFFVKKYILFLFENWMEFK